MEESKNSYCVVGFYKPGESRVSLISSNGKVIVFDTPLLAYEIVNTNFRDQRSMIWDSKKEQAYLIPVLPDRINRYVLITPYDIYNLPPGLPIKSETRNMAWKYHVHWAQWWSGDKI